MPEKKTSAKRKPAGGAEPGKVEPGSVEYWELVRARAYLNWEERCRCNLPGDESADWLRAEEEVNTMIATTYPRQPSSRRRK